METKFSQKPRNCWATSSSEVAVGVPWEKPVPMGWSIQTTLVRWCQLHLLAKGRKTPGCQRKGPLDWVSSPIEEQPGPPVSQMRISLEDWAAGLVEGKNQKKSWLEVSFAWMGRRPA